VHLVLATQRPAGAVSDNIKANANLRIALRVQDAGDSSDVIGSPVAAELPRTRAGRAYVRLGPSELELLQCALATGPVRAGPPPPVELRPFGFGSDGAFDVAMLEEDGGPSELDELVDAALAAFVASGVPAPRRPWPEPLPAEVDLDALDGACFALADDPDGQCQVPHGWRRADGNLLLVGIGGSGTTTALVSIALALSSRCGPDRLHLYAMDFGAGDLAPLSRLPHTGAVIHAGERERQARLVRHLRAELERRRSSAGESAPRAPEIVVLLDGYAAFASEFSDAAGMAVLDDLVRVLADGPDVGIRAVVAADRVGAVPSAVAALIRQRLIFRLAEPHDFAAAGVAGPPPARLEAGRAIDVETRRVVQLARPSRGVGVAVDAIAAHWPAAAGPDAPAPIGELPRHVRVSDIARRGRLDQRPWFVPIGIGERALEPAGLVLYEGEHALIAGPARSGRSTTLCTIAAVIAAQQVGALVISVAGPRSPLAGCGVDEAIAAVAGHDGPALLLVDDAEQVEDRTGALAALVARAPEHVHVVAAGRSEVLRTAYQHWTRGLRRSRSGLLLAPNPDLDGELLGQVLPRRAPVTLGPGRGWLVDGSDLEVVQVATLDDA
jgi:S-DNA-T family DNA segregation ATPase FtsK/SpoIIIE